MSSKTGVLLVSNKGIHRNESHSPFSALTLLPLYLFSLQKNVYSVVQLCRYALAPHDNFLRFYRDCHQPLEFLNLFHCEISFTATVQTCCRDTSRLSQPFSEKWGLDVFLFLASLYVVLHVGGDITERYTNAFNRSYNPLCIPLAEAAAGRKLVVWW